jgi:hypothetical protein
MAGPDILRRQLERVRFEKAIDYIMANAGGRKHLNAQELVAINNIMTATDSDPWRHEATSLKVPSGKHVSFSLISNPVFAVRDLLAQVSTIATNGQIEEAASELYSQLVLNHFFIDANRRTAVAATYWLLLENGIDIPAVGLLELGIGDIRAKEQIESLRHLIKVTILISKGRKP